LKRSKLTVMLLAGALLALPVANALAAGYNLGGEGSKATAMGGAFRAIADDWSAMYWNPAGIAGQRNSFTLQFKGLMPMTTVTPSRQAGPVYTAKTEYQTESAMYPAGALAVVYGINNKLTAGFSVFAPTAAGATWKDFVQIDPTLYGSVARDATDWESSLTVIDIHPTVAYKVNEKFRVGLGIAIKYATITMQLPYAIPGVPIPPYDYMYALGKLDGTGMGFGGNVGLMYDVTPKLHLGATFTMPTTVKLSGTMTQTLYMWDLTPVMGPFPPYDGSKLSADMDTKADFTLPMEAGFGVAYDVNPKLTVSFDIAYTNWAAVDTVKLELSGKDAFGADATDTHLSLMYENTIRYSVGASYQAMDKLNLRLGYYYDPSAIPDDHLTPLILDVAAKQDISFGLGYKINEKLSCEGYFEYVFTGTRKIKKLYLDPSVSEDSDQRGNIPGKWKLTLPVFGVSFQYNFSVAAAPETEE